MSHVSALVNRSLSSVENHHVVDEANVSPAHARLDLMPLGRHVQCVESLCLGLAQAGDAGGARFQMGGVR